MSSYRITYDEDAQGNMILRYSGDVQNLVDACAEDVRLNREQRGPHAAGKSDLRKMMSLDPVVLMEIAKQNNLSPFDPAVFEIAKGRDYSRFRTVDDKLYFKRASKRRVFVPVKK